MFYLYIGCCFQKNKKTLSSVLIIDNIVAEGGFLASGTTVRQLIEPFNRAMPFENDQLNTLISFANATGCNEFSSEGRLVRGELHVRLKLLALARPSCPITSPFTSALEPVRRPKRLRF